MMIRFQKRCSSLSSLKKETLRAVGAAVMLRNNTGCTTLFVLVIGDLISGSCASLDKGFLVRIANPDWIRLGLACFSKTFGYIGES